MPILEVEIVLRPGEVLRDGLAADIADRAAAVFGSLPGRTWVRLRTLQREQYAEDGGGPPEGILAVFVSITHRQRPYGQALRDEIARLTESIAAACDRPPENVHLIYEDDAEGRISFGGELVT